jgi:hypothetical protein
MKIFETITDYIKEAKINDIIVFNGSGLINGILTLDSRNDTYKVTKISENQIWFKAYRCKKQLTTQTNQKVALLTKKEIKNLPPF